MKLEDLITANSTIIEDFILHKIISKQTIPADLREIKPEYFTASRRELFDEIKAQYDAYGKVDPFLLKDKYTDAYINAMDMVCLPDPTIVAVDELRKLYQKREIAETIYSANIEDDPEQGIRELHSEISKLLLNGNSKEYNHRESVQNLIAAIEDAQKSKKTIKGYSTMIPVLDVAISGIQKGKFYVVGALKKTGKSRFGVYLSCVLRSQGAGVFWNTLEMNCTDLNTLALGYYSGLNSSCFGTYIKNESYPKVSEGTNQLLKLDWTIESEKQVPDLKARIERTRLKKPVDVVLVDYIQNMTSPKYPKDRTREVEDVVKGLAGLSRELDVAIIGFAQLSGAAEDLNSDKKNKKDDDNKEETIPDMRHLKESQAIAEAADTIIILHNPNRHKAHSGGEQQLKIRIEGRYCLSGPVLTIGADLGKCNFKQIT